MKKSSQAHPLVYSPPRLLSRRPTRPPRRQASWNLGDKTLFLSHFEFMSTSRPSTWPSICLVNRLSSSSWVSLDPSFISIYPSNSRTRVTTRYSSHLIQIWAFTSHLEASQRWLKCAIRAFHQGIEWFTIFVAEPCTDFKTQDWLLTESSRRRGHFLSRRRRVSRTFSNNVRQSMVFQSTDSLSDRTSDIIESKLDEHFMQTCTTALCARLATT